MNPRSAAIVLLTLLLASACGAEGPRDKLRHAAFLFNDGLRWGRYQEVFSRLDPETREHFMELHADWGDKVQVSDVEPVQYVFSEDGERADVTVQFTWYRNDELVVHVTRTVQHWEQRKGEWVMIGEEHVAGVPF
ncbi:MAG TPA: hypothetical protein VM285_09300 [Polyangia bacterium]|nr:hypothetical protein [Polyangia bacterium]